MGIDVRINGISDKKSLLDSVEITKLNVDITTLLAYVSAQSNGSNNWEFKDPVLTQQAARERTNPVKPFLEKTFEGN